MYFWVLVKIHILNTEQDQSKSSCQVQTVISKSHFHLEPWYYKFAIGFLPNNSATDLSSLGSSLMVPKILTLILLLFT